MTISQLKLRIHWDKGTTRPLLNRYISMAVNNRIAAATWLYVFEMKLERASVVSSETGV